MLCSSMQPQQFGSQAGSTECVAFDLVFIAGSCSVGLTRHQHIFPCCSCQRQRESQLHWQPFVSLAPPACSPV